MTIQTKLYQKDTLVEGINIALKNRLYISGWSLSGTLKNMRAYPNDEQKIAITYKDDKPVALVVYYPSHFSENHQAFCRKSERQKGYATLAMKEIIKNSHDKIRWSEGVSGSEKFWNKFPESKRV